jgi:hypothetical protein
MALEKERNTPRLGDDIHPYDFPLDADAIIFKGALVCLDDGYLVPGSTTTGLKAVGRARESADNTDGDAGDITIAVDSGIFRYNNSADSDLIAQADVGADCYVVDDEKVAKTSATNTRSVAGKIIAVDSHGVWVQLKHAS